MRSVLELMSPLRKIQPLAHHQTTSAAARSNGRAPREELGAHAPVVLEGVVAAYMVRYQALSRQDYSPFLSRGLATLVSRVSFCVESREAIFNMGLDHSKWRLKPQLIWGYIYDLIASETTLSLLRGKIGYIA